MTTLPSDSDYGDDDIDDMPPLEWDSDSADDDIDYWSPLASDSDSSESSDDEDDSEPHSPLSLQVHAMNAPHSPMSLEVYAMDAVIENIHIQYDDVDRVVQYLGLPNLIQGFICDRFRERYAEVRAIKFYDVKEGQVPSLKGFATNRIIHCVQSHSRYSSMCRFIHCLPLPEHVLVELCQTQTFFIYRIMHILWLRSINRAISNEE